ncbi:hypothetical protein ACWEHA_06190 [Amycolatopsis nivea]
MAWVAYPAVVYAPHFQIGTVTGRDGLRPLDERLYASREDAKAWALALREAGDTVRITEFGVAYCARCVVCGEFSDEHRLRFPGWLELTQHLTHEPGWSWTSEQLVFCPVHRFDDIQE